MLISALPAEAEPSDPTRDLRILAAGFGACAGAWGTIFGMLWGML